MKKYTLLLIILISCKKDSQQFFKKGDQVRVVSCDNCKIERPAFIDTVLYRGPDASEYQVSDTQGHTGVFWNTNLYGDKPSQ